MVRRSDFNEAIRRDPGTAPAFAGRRGLVRQSNAAYAAALVDYTPSLSLEPDNAPILAECGDLFEVTGDHARAIADYTAALRLDPKLATAFRGRSVSYRSSGRLPQAEADLRRFQALRSPAPASAAGVRKR